MLGQPERNGSTFVAFLRPLLETRLARRGDCQLGHGEDAIEQKEDEEQEDIQYHLRFPTRARMHIRRARTWHAGIHAGSMRAVSTGSRTLHRFAGKNPCDDDARLIEEIERNEDDRHIERVRRRRNHRRQDEQDQDGIFAEGAHLRRARHAELGQDEHDNRQLKRQPQAEHERQEERDDGMPLRRPFEEITHKGGEERQRPGCREEEGVRHAEQEQQDHEWHRKVEKPLLLFRQSRNQEPDQLPHQDRQRDADGDIEGNLEIERDRVGRTDDVEAANSVGFDLETLEERARQEDTGDKRHANSDHALDDPVAQLLHVLEKRHLLEHVGFVRIGQPRPRRQLGGKLDRNLLQIWRFQCAGHEWLSSLCAGAGSAKRIAMSPQGWPSNAATCASPRTARYPLCSSIYCTASETVRIFSASSSLISRSNSCSIAMMTSTRSSESAFRSPMNSESIATLSSSTPSLSATITRTRSNVVATLDPPHHTPPGADALVQRRPFPQVLRQVTPYRRDQQKPRSSAPLAVWT